MASFDPIGSLLGGGLIGLASVLLMMFTARIAGISGLLAGCLMLSAGDRLWRLGFIVGLVLAPVASGLLGYPLSTPLMPATWVTITIAGLLVGFGTRLGGGCTSGHGVCGVARLSARSIVATTIFMASCYRCRCHHASWLGMMALASLLCGLIFGFGLLISGMTQPENVLGFLDIFGRWDLTLALVMAAALVVSGIGFAMVRNQRRPVLTAQHLFGNGRRNDHQRSLEKTCALEQSRECLAANF